MLDERDLVRIKANENKLESFVFQPPDSIARFVDKSTDDSGIDLAPVGQSIARWNISSRSATIFWRTCTGLSQAKMPPASADVPPTFLRFSRTTIFLIPLSAAAMAAARPEPPPPMTTKSAF